MIRWGVVGVGLAGRARVRALRDDPRAEPVLGYRGDPAAAGLASAPSLEALLDAVDAVAICSPDRTHPDLVRAALARERHVLCEFPLAPDGATARAPFAFARERDRVLHVEHIELLGPAARWIRQRAAGRQLRGGVLRFRGGPRPDAWSLCLANVARLHRLVDAVGLPLGWDGAKEVAGSFQGVLRYPQGIVQVGFEHAPGARRRTEMVLDLDDGTVAQLDETVLDGGVPVPLAGGGGLFLADQLGATARILDGAPPYVSDERVADVLDLAAAG